MLRIDAAPYQGYSPRELRSVQAVGCDNAKDCGSTDYGLEDFFVADIHNHVVPCSGMSSGVVCFSPLPIVVLHSFRLGISLTPGSAMMKQMSAAKPRTCLMMRKLCCNRLLKVEPYG